MPVSALFDSVNKVNAIYPTFAKELGFLIRHTNLRVQKIDGIMLDTYGIVVAAFLLINKVNRIRFFEEIFLMTNISPEVVLEMLFFTLSGANINFLGWELC